MIRAKRKPRKCPQCGSSRIANILYGMPEFSPEFEKRIEDGKIALGGCCISNDDPVWKCVECEADIYKTKV
ncbi:MAG: hypothetical protein HOI47_19455 [Candidatus Scalindua sp.]|jgi:hypothetical protein|nr:hypothetical protein [Candidatus Scalindua sp.]